ncbi:MAG: RNA-binding protein [Clostridiales bacterium 38_11]|nr:MAG: RNA-binding protein [Clostridiales bacterium 38_11]HBH13717.1 RNA-binding protein [Clostridiales bacterium]
MIKLGEMQFLKLNKVDTKDLIFIDENGTEVFVKKEKGKTIIEKGEMRDVFVYKMNNRLEGSLKRPLLVIGEIGYLKVVDITEIGAFMEWGLDKNLFLPFKQQKGQIRVGHEYIVGIYLDKSERLCATMDIYEMLKTDSPYKIGDKVKGTIYSLKRGLGAMVAVENKYHGLIQEKDFFGKGIGDQVEARVVKVREDGKLNLNLFDKTHTKMDDDAEVIYKRLVKAGGFLPYSDKTNPNLIKETFNMSKGSFKIAIGRLYKRDLITISDKGIGLKRD